MISTDDGPRAASISAVCANEVGFAMALTIRSALATDAHAIGSLAKQFAIYLRSLGDQTDFIDLCII